jgi:phage tail protein X
MMPLQGPDQLVSALLVLIIMSVRQMDTLSELTGRMYQHPFTVSKAVLSANANIISMHGYMKDVF